MMRRSLCLFLVVAVVVNARILIHDGDKRADTGDTTPAPQTTPDQTTPETPQTTPSKDKAPSLDDGGKLSAASMKKLLSEINRYRLMHDATPLGNCPVCADAAQKHVDEMAQSGIEKPDHKAKYGQVIFSTKDQADVDQGADYFGTLVAAKMYNQIKNYDFVKSEFKENAADFSQLIWEGSEVVGFASGKGGDGNVYVVMYLNPPGNNDTMSYYENVNRVTGAGDIEVNGKMKCPDGWTLDGTTCWQYFEEEYSWPDAVDHCNVLKGSLASAECMDEGSNIRKILEDKKTAWIGMSDMATKGGFQFVDGTPYVYSDWSVDSYQWLYSHPGEATSKCITASKDGWNYKECTDKLPFICKMRPNGVTSYALYLYFPGSTYTNDLGTPDSTRYNNMKNTVDKAIKAAYGTDTWFGDYTFYQFMPRENGEAAASTLVKFAPDVRAPVDPISKLRIYLREQSDLKILGVRLIPGNGRVTTATVSDGTCPSGCSGDCYPECNPGCCGAAVSLSAPAIPSGYTACPQYPACGTSCQPSCSQTCCQQNPYQMAQTCPQSPGCSPQCAPACSQRCCQQQPAMSYLQQPACPQFPRCSPTCAPACNPQCCQQQQLPVMLPMQQPACPQSPRCSPTCAPSCTPQCCQRQMQQVQPMMPMQQACPQFPRCSPTCAPSCSPSCCQQQQMPQMQPMMMQQPACPQMPSCSPACAPQCTPGCCQQQQQQMPPPQIITGKVMIQPVQQPAPMMPAPQQTACSGIYPGCAAACAPACRPMCCGNLMGKKRSRVSKHKKGSKKSKTHHH